VSARRTRRLGVALLLALVAVVVVSLVGSMALDAALQDLRLSRASRAQLAAAMRVDSVLATWRDAPIDSGWLRAATGSATTSRSAVNSDTLTLTIQRLGGQMLRVVASSRSRSGGRRGDAAASLLLLIVGDSAAPGGLRLRRAPGWWWVPDP
jgi:hypothetical protein